MAQWIEVHRAGKEPTAITINVARAATFQTFTPASRWNEESLGYPCPGATIMLDVGGPAPLSLVVVETYAELQTMLEG